MSRPVFCKSIKPQGDHHISRELIVEQTNQAESENWFPIIDLHKCKVLADCENLQRAGASGLCHGVLQCQNSDFHVIVHAVDSIGYTSTADRYHRTAAMSESGVRVIHRIGHAHMLKPEETMDHGRRVSTLGSDNDGHRAMSPANLRLLKATFNPSVAPMQNTVSSFVFDAILAQQCTEASWCRQ